MDPNVALETIKRIVEDVIAHEGKVVAEDALELAEHFNGLDSWISGGGFLPERWQRAAEEVRRQKLLKG